MEQTAKSTPDLEFDTRAYRRALGVFVTGVAIATALDVVGRPRGLTINSFTSVSLKPPLVLICIADTAGCYDVFRQTSDFAVNILSEDQRGISDLFASKAEDKFDYVTWSAEPQQAPQILGSLATFQCKVEKCIVAGDHIMVLGRVKSFDAGARRPLVYAQGGYISIVAQQAAVSGAPGHNVVVSCIAERDGKVLFIRGKSGQWELLSAQLESPTDQLSSLTDAFKKFGLRVEITFLYSVFESENKTLNVVYRGTLHDGCQQTDLIKFLGEDEIPWQELHPAPVQGMLRRFFRERELDQFGIYADLSTPGFVAGVGKVPEAWDAYVSKLSKS